jgi:dipeptidyl aminopeptidase/acylaminoacyl peptidase
VPWEREANETIERWNPIRFVQNWRTPMLVIHGERDYPHPVQPVARHVQRAAAPQHPVAAWSCTRTRITGS